MSVSSTTQFPPAQTNPTFVPVSNREKPMELNGCPCQALLDSGSQVTIVFDHWYSQHLPQIPIYSLTGLSIWGLSSLSYPYKKDLTTMDSAEALSFQDQLSNSSARRDQQEENLLNTGRAIQALVTQVSELTTQIQQL
ncbi:hypothetical protein QQF64_036347 [Cirrhinus molitorella]|uniref:Peptidase A2 domain-containing protein n=1 Tax=Cirrhinus molitorella TaxID=172907 RepID=A0ABR3NII9_9TELE